MRALWPDRQNCSQHVFQKLNKNVAYQARFWHGTPWAWWNIWIAERPQGMERLESISCQGTTKVAGSNSGGILEQEKTWNLSLSNAKKTILFHRAEFQSNPKRSCPCNFRWDDFKNREKILWLFGNQHGSFRQFDEHSYPISSLGTLIHMHMSHWNGCNLSWPKLAIDQILHGTSEIQGFSATWSYPNT